VRLYKAFGLSLLIAFMLMTTTVYAVEDNALSLDEIVANERQAMQEESTSYQEPEDVGQAGGSSMITTTGVEQSIRDSSMEMMGTLGDAAVLDTTNPKATEAAGKLKNIVNIIVTLLAYIIVFGLSIRVALDLLYIGLPFSRKFLGNGYAGNARAGDVNAASPMGGMGLGSSPYGGFGGGGMGGYGGGFNRFGGMGFGSRFGMGGMGSASNSPGAYQDQMGTMTGRLQLVSNAALNAAASEATIDPDGRNASPFKIYAKDMAITLILTPILLILAVSGALLHIGLVIGGGIATLLSGISNMI
jgi:hypothetical protein